MVPRMDEVPRVVDQIAVMVGRKVLRKKVVAASTILSVTNRYTFPTMNDDTIGWKESGVSSVQGVPHLAYQFTPGASDGTVCRSGSPPHKA